MEGINLAEISITSSGRLIEGTPLAESFIMEETPDIGVVSKIAEGVKCVRCWQVLIDVGTHGHPDICGRCVQAVEALATENNEGDI